MIFRHVCYAPELETLNDTRSKLNNRRQEIENKLKAPPQNRKRKLSATSTSVVRVHCPSLVIEETISDPNAECFTKTEPPNSEESKKVTVAGKQSQPVYEPPKKRIVYHISSKTKTPRLNV